MEKTNIALEYMRDEILGTHLDTEGLTEIAINRPGELHTKINGVWSMHECSVTYEQCEAFASALAVWQDDNIDETSPILSATLPSGQRCQVVFPPACERGTISVTIRIPDYFQRTHQSYIEAGFYNRVTGKEKKETKDDELAKIYHSGNIPLFMEKCVEYGKTIFVVGETGSGKTTYMKMLLRYIPAGLRIITIEDNPEIKFWQHQNYVHLFYPADAGEDAIVTSDRLVRAIYRMNPDRPLLAEVRGREAWDALKLIESGHPGFMSSLHAGSPQECISGLIDRCMEHPACRGMPEQVLLRKVLRCMDVIVSVDISGNVRRMGDIYFKYLHLDAMKEKFSHA
ncbi:P-type DNA transfer ATPase VirB11 (plasmid) [Buttiauxella sp. 3AFRM03]|nr:P-type DNA transfer ATPase VirB11 [Buttiauxella sp. 3AFRM03]AYN25690.1 P-type DNA transfer ATPase VirB11 [Buttiauxella sp. 3AFRM03]